MKGSVGPTTYSFLIVVASSLLSTIGVFWVVLWIDIVFSGEKCSDLFSQLFQGIVFSLTFREFISAWNDASSQSALFELARDILGVCFRIRMILNSFQTGEKDLKL